MTCVTLCHTLLFNSEKGKNKTKLKNKNKREKNEITKFPLVNSNMEKKNSANTLTKSLGQVLFN